MIIPVNLSFEGGGVGSRPTYIIYDVDANTVLTPLFEDSQQYILDFDHLTFCLCAQNYSMPSCSSMTCQQYYSDKFFVFQVSGFDANDFKDLDHFDFDTVGNQTVGVPFLIKVYAKDNNGVTITGFNAVCGIETSPLNHFGDYEARFPPYAKFTAGVWTGYVNQGSNYAGWMRVTQSGTFQIKIFGGGKSSLSNSFTVS